MVVHTAITSSRKRKATTEMVDSPPKRLTRARAAKVDATSGIDSKAAKDKISVAVTTAAKSVKPKAKAPATKPASRHAVGGTRQLDEATEERKKTSEAGEPRKTRGRPRKATTEVDGQVPDATGPKPRTRQLKAEITVPAPQAMSSLKQVISRESQKPDTLDADQAAAEPLHKRTRTRGGAAAVKASTSTSTKAPTTRKKVAFEEQSEQDKENRPSAVECSKQGKDGAKRTGLKAKPIRRAAPVRTTRGRKATQAESPTSSKPQPLSPKKVTQVAKSSSCSSEDEVAFDAEPVKTLATSPSKATLGASNDTEDATTTKSANSASDLDVSRSTILASPARRPPPPMFKDAAKESPKRVNILNGLPQFTGPSTLSPFKGSVKESPKRIKFISNSQSMVAVSQSPIRGLINESPKRVNFLNSSVQKALDPNHSPLKTSLLQSPPKRHLSPTKVSGLESPRKSDSAVPFLHSDINSNEVNTFKLPTLTPQRLFASSVPVVASEGIEESHSPREHLHEEVSGENADKTQVSEVVQIEDVIMSGTTPSETARYTAQIASSKDFGCYRSSAEDADSEDELLSGENTGMTSPRRRHKFAVIDFASPQDVTPVAASFSMDQTKEETPMFSRPSGQETGQGSLLSMTPLAAQLSSWQASSPEKRGIEEVRAKSHGMFSIVKPVVPAGECPKTQLRIEATPEKSTFFEDEMAVREREQLTPTPHLSSDTDPAEHQSQVDPSAEYNEVEEYGDENAVPIDPQILDNFPRARSPVVTITPARIFQSSLREIHTVSKVPLRASTDESALKVSRIRRRSVSGPLSDVTGMIKPVRPTVDVSEIILNAENENTQEERFVSHVTPAKSVKFSADVASPSEQPVTAFGTPFRAVREGLDAQILRGAVVFVDVHTTEGADASGIFVELLTQMGARCVKQWNWNPHASTANERHDPENADEPFNNKVGITHVVFKDGGKRTLQKVRESKGLVLCVGVGWVLE